MAVTFDDLLTPSPKTQATPSSTKAGMFDDLLTPKATSTSASETDPDFNKIISIESGGRQVDKAGNPLTSSAGAIGVAQVMPSTAQEAADAAGVPFDDKLYRTDKEYNAKLGNAYFKKMKSLFNGDAEKAAAAYNAGPTKVKETIEKYGDTWREHLPDETQNYIKKFGKATLNASAKFVSGKDLFADLTPKADATGKDMFADLVTKTSTETPALKKKETLLDTGKQVIKNLVGAARAGEADVLALGNLALSTPEFVTKVAATPYFGLVSALDNAKDKKIAAIDWAESSNRASKVANWAFGPMGKTGPAISDVLGLSKEYETSLPNKGLEYFGKGMEWTGKQVEEKTGIPSAGTQAVLETLMVTGIPGGKYAYTKGKELFKPKEDTTSFEDKLNKFEMDLSGNTKGQSSHDASTASGHDMEEAGKTLPTDPYIGNKSDTGLPIKQGVILDHEGQPALDSSGRPRMAILQRDVEGNPSHIELNLEEIAKRFEEKPWVKLGRPEDTFKTPEQYARFILKHEEEHVLQSFDEWKATHAIELDDNLKPKYTEAELRRQYEIDINQRAKAKHDAEINQTLEDHPVLYELGDVFKDDTYSEHNATNAIHRTLVSMSLNDRAARILRETIEQLIPNKKIRERMTMAKEAQRETDKLLTDQEKSDLLYGTGKVNDQGHVDSGLTGVLPKMLDKINKTPDGGMISYFDSKIGEHISIPKEEYIKKYEALNHVVNTLKELPSEEAAIKLLDTLEKQLKGIGEQAKAEGLIDALRQNYIPHVIDFSESTLSKGQQRSLLDRLALDPKESRLNRDFAEHRVYRYIRDLEKRMYEVANEMGLDTTGLKVQRDIARIFEVYQKSFVNATIQKRLTNFLEKQLVDTPSKEKLGLITKNYDLGFANNYEKFIGTNSQALDGYLVHPDIIASLKHLYRQKEPNLALRIAGSISMLSKVITTAGSLFHATSLAIARATTTPVGMLKEIATGFSGTRAALDTIRHDGLNKNVDAWAYAGLKFADHTNTDDFTTSVVSEVSKAVDNTVTKLFTDKDVKITRHVINPVDEQILQRLSTFTFEFMHAAGKYNTAEYLYSQIKARNPELKDEFIREEVSRHVNQTFGGLDWYKIAHDTTNKTLRDIALNISGQQGRLWMQVLMYAPDWTVSTFRSYSHALPKDMFKPKEWELKKGALGLINPTTSGDLARRYVITTGILYLTAINGINMAITGRPVWTNQDPTRIDLGDGSTMQLAKHSMEGPHWALHPVKTAINKLGYIPKVAVSLASPYVNTPMDALKVLGEPFVPFQISAAINAPNGEGLKRGVASFMGMPIYGQPDKQHQTMEQHQEKHVKNITTRHEHKEEKMKRQ